ncbi:putative acyl-CoA oxidase [Trypanosoma conorhini]|uniref:Putative acyl-CoA oxidase n=1 Tax=Trypanosoma conorhini TaxID=83891 RepID=A0A422PN55_9TRYP|nr:putative acyl-CoA oxidase [Trypanosoma conorhini]RNF19165.1 putative acyl-CoA oxidase [Trypanosoma conorhini]
MLLRGVSRVSAAAAAHLPPQTAVATLFATSGMLATPIRVQYRLFHRSFPLQLELNPARQLYSMEHAFEEPTFRFICEGRDIDYRAEVRATLLEVIAKKPSNFVDKTDEVWLQETLPQRTAQLLRAVAKKQLLSFAQVKSTPQLFPAFFEVLATCSAPLALLAADHFTFAAMIATHGTAEAQKAILDDVDTCRVIGTIAHRELIADGAPLNTEARYDKDENCFVLRGAGKFAVVGAGCADWAIVTATLTLNKRDNHGLHAFVVQLRERGALKRGVSVRPMQGEHPAMSASGAGVLHFADVRLPLSALLLPSRIVGGEVSVTEDADTPTSLQALTLQMRLATAALYAGMLKRLLANIVPFIARKDVVGPDGRRNYPFFGVQHVQTPLVEVVAKSYVYLADWRRMLAVFAAPAGRRPDYEDEMKLAGTIHFLQETLLDLRRFVDAFMGVHASLESTGSSEAALMVHLRQEGVDQSALIREVAFKSVTRNIGTSHWGWWLTSLLQPFAAADRFVKNPFYSPRIADLGRHLIFFSHKHYRAKKRLRLSREIERRKGGAEHQWYDWVMFRHQQVLHCGEAYMEMYSMEVMMEETQACTDPRARKILRDIGWIYALARQRDRLDYVLTQQMLSPGKANVLESHLDNLVTVLAPQCVNLVEAFQVPAAFRAACAGDNFEAYWTIPGTNTGIQRGDRVTLFHAKDSTRDTKAEQEQMQESEEEWDLFHGIAAAPSFAQKK